MLLDGEAGATLAGTTEVQHRQGSRVHLDMLDGRYGSHAFYRNSSKEQHNCSAARMPVQT